MSNDSKPEEGDGIPSLFIGTSSVIAHERDRRHMVCVIEHYKTKHDGRLTIVGGRVVIPKQVHPDAADEEFTQEVGGMGAILEERQPWAVKTDPYSDIRLSTFGKLTHGQCRPEHSDIVVRGHYGCPDVIYTAVVNGTPWPNDHEAVRAFFTDVFEIRITETPEESKFGAQHDLYLAVYALYLKGRPVDISDFADLKALRAKLLSWQR